jgi:selenocysteine-specific elongation factor
MPSMYTRSENRAGVRELHSHGAAVQGVAEGQRAALNITGVEKEEITRGMEVATPGYLTPSRYIDARVRVLPRREKSLVSHVRVRLSIGTADVFATPVVVGASELHPGETAIVQLRLFEPIVAAFGQRFIIRTVAAQATIGGGTSSARSRRVYGRRTGLISNH